MIKRDPRCFCTAGIFLRFFVLKEKNRAEEDTLRSAFFRTPAGVTEKITVLETLADKIACRGAFAASPNSQGSSHTAYNEKIT